MSENLNRTCVWDGSFIFETNPTLINQFQCGVDKIKEYKFSQGTLICMDERIKDDFTVVVEMIKNFFNITARGFHRAIIDGSYHNLYYVNICDHNIIYENPVSSLDKTHRLRNDENFRQRMQDLIVFLDIMCLRGSNESNIRVRKIGDDFFPVAYNAVTSIVKSESCDSIIVKNLIYKWFREDEDYTVAVRRLVNNFEKKTGFNLIDLSFVLDKAISRVSKQYKWYSNLIKRRLKKFGGY